MSASGDLIDESDLTNWVSGATEAQKQAIIDQVEDRIYKITGDAFYQESFDVYIDGNGKNRIFMPFLPDLLSITSVTISGIVLDSDYYTFDTHSIYLSELAASTHELNYLLDYVSDRCIFPRGIKNIQIVGVRGCTTVPANIKRAAILLCEDQNDVSLYTHYIKGTESEGSYSASSSDEPLTGIREVDELLGLYIKRRAILFA